MSDSLLKKRMKTKKDIERIIIENMKNRTWCKDACERALKYLQKFKDDDTIDIIAKNIPEEWAYYWARDVGDRGLMRKFIHSEYWAFKWACKVGDKELMKKLIHTEEGALEWAFWIGDIEYMSRFIKSKYWKDRWKEYIGEYIYIYD